MQPKIHPDDTIAAIATPPGEGAIAIVRVSGGEAVAIGDRIFRGRSPLSTSPGYSVHHGYVCDRVGRIVDEVLVTVFRSPHSYTGEDSIEVSCHGGAIAPGRILSVLLQNGARQADPGEFTKRAFLRGRIDLTQAEAVADLISSRSVRAQELSLAQMQGSLGRQIAMLKEELLAVCSLLEIDLDFSEEGISVVSADEIAKRLQTTQAAMSDILQTFETGQIIREGVRVVLAGLPNAGKSSIFNALLRRDRSIVSEQPGTTRDYIEESISISGILFTLVDTAGVRDSTDPAELEGVSRSRNLVKSSDITVVVIDLANPPDSESLTASLSGINPERTIIAFNKADLRSRSERPVGFPRIAKDTEVFVSALAGTGLHDLKAALVGVVAGSGNDSESTLVITNRRHANSLTKAFGAVSEAIGSLAKGMTNEFIAVDVRAAMGALSSITGETTSEDVLNRIFEGFCVGK